MMAFGAPRKLRDSDDLSSFSCGVDVVDAWAHVRVHRAMAQGTAVVYVVEVKGEGEFDSAIAGFYALSAHSVLRDDVKGGWLRRNVPEQIPVVLLGMLGVDARYQGQGLGWSLLRDAILRSQRVSGETGARALIVDPANEGAVSFYTRYGFRALPETNRLFLPLC